jgi:putative transposase
MRYNQPEKVEIIRLVEESNLSIRRTLAELDIPRSTFYNWYSKFLDNGYDGLADLKPNPKRIWSRIPDSERDRVRQIALERPELTPRELAWHITDSEKYFISESSVYRILKSFDLIASPNYVVISASDKFQNPTKRVNEMWQTDFTYFKIVGWGWYYLATVLDDFSRYIVTWKLFNTMLAEDVKTLLDMAVAETGVDQVKVKHRPRLLSDNGSCYVSDKLRKYLEDKGMDHTRGAPYHPQTQGKIERYHRTMKNVILLRHFYLPQELEAEVGRFVDYYNHSRYHESLENVTPADVFFGRQQEILAEREMIKRKTLAGRKSLNLGSFAAV